LFERGEMGEDLRAVFWFAIARPGWCDGYNGVDRVEDLEMADWPLGRGEVIAVPKGAKVDGVRGWGFTSNDFDGARSVGGISEGRL
jgi:hypothetical protein